jgi:methionyl-tRNA formyltransferase
VAIKLAFMGSATFALPSLDALFEAGYTIAGVLTQPDKPSGRGQSLQGPPVKKRAFELHLPVFQPASLKTDAARQLAAALAPDLIVVVAYGKILPPWLLELPRNGCINLHGSLLPKYRGAAPVHWAIANGDDNTGVCTMQLDAGLDTGPVYLCQETDIQPDETSSHLYDRLAMLGAPLVVKTVAGILAGTLKPTPQEDFRATMAPLLKKEDGFLNWKWPALKVHNRVRAFNPWPGTVTGFRGRTCRILKTAIAGSLPSGQTPADAGSVAASRGRLLVACGDGILLEIFSIQPENRKAVTGSDFANGARVQAGEKFVSLSDN